MISRRHLLSTLGYLGIGSFLFKNTYAQSKIKSSSSEEQKELPPHCEALSLVWNSQQKLIREVETQYAKAEQAKQKEYVSAESRWWFDTEKRSWEVNRPTPPGGIDTTHDFVVSYLIDGKVVAKWFVGTSDKQIVLAKQ